MVFPWIPFPSEPETDDMADHYYPFGLYAGTLTSSGTGLLGVNDEDTVNILGFGVIAEGGINSLHLQDDSTDYQNTSGAVAYAVIIVRGDGTGTQARHIKIYSAPTTNSKVGATELFDYDGPDFDANNQLITTPILEIQNNHYIVVENIDESRAGTNSIDFVLRNSLVVERG